MRKTIIRKGSDGMNEAKKKAWMQKLIFVLILILLEIAIVIGALIMERKYIGTPEGAALLETLEASKVTLNQFGFLRYPVMVLVQILQMILALIPGGPFEIGAGYAFGIFWGTIMCDIAMSLGGIINFLLSRRYGMRFIELFTTREKIESVRFLKNHKRWEALLFLFFLLPGTPKDLMCYVVGLTKLPLKKWIFINVVGRLPGIILSALSGAALGKEKYGLFAIAIIVLFLLYLL